MPKGNPTAQTIASEKYQKKVGFISKSYKLKKDIVESFAEACEANGVSQSATITELMKNYIKGDNTMEELKKCYQELQKRIAEIEAKHETHIDDFYNLDEDIRADYMGDWTERDVQGWEYLVNRASTIWKAYKIVAEDLHIGEFLPDIDK